MSVVFGRVSKGTEFVKKLSTLDTKSNYIEITNCGEVGKEQEKPIQYGYAEGDLLHFGDGLLN